MERISAILFDLFGTLLDLDQRALLRELRKNRVLAAPQLAPGILRTLLVRSYDSDEAMLRDWCRAMGIFTPTREQRECVNSIISKYMRGITVRRGVPTILAFLRRRGFKIGLLSNTAQAFKPALKASHLDRWFDHALFSCDLGVAKPDPTAYLELCRRLAVPPSDCLFVGDSVINDYTTPLTLGMRALCLREVGVAPAARLNKIEDLAWLCWSTGPQFLKPIIRPGLSFFLDSKEWTIQLAEATEDGEQGRYNIVARIVAADTQGHERTFFCKRYLLPESAYVEEMAYKLMDMVGLAGCHAALVNEGEPILIVSQAEGVPWANVEVDESAIEAIGAHCAMAWIIGNADTRPRNTFIDHANGCSRISVIDLEHCFFDRALDMSGHESPFSPQVIDSLNDQVHTLTRHRVASPAGTRRTRRSFLAVDDKASRPAQVFRSGWLRTYRAIQEVRKTIELSLLDRIYQTPPLIIGTQSYRRALARIDVDDMMQRIQEDPAEAFERLY